MSTKRILALILTLVMCFSLAAPAYAVGESYTVTFVYGDGNIVEQTVVADQEDALGSFGMLNKPADPTREDANGIRYVFDRWESSEGGDFFNGEDAVAIRSDETVTARWEEHLAEGSEIVAQNENGDIEYLSDTTKTITEIVGSKNIVRVQDVALKASNEQGENSVAQVGGIYYDTLQQAIDAAEAGSTVTLVKDSTTDSRINVTKSVTIDGQNQYTIAVTNKDNRVIDIDSTTNVTLTLKDVTVDGMNVKVDIAYPRGISMYGNTNVKLVVDHATIKAIHYAINVAGANNGVTVEVKNSSVAAGWAGINVWSPANITVTGSTVSGVNDKKYNSDGWNNFSTVVMNHDDSNSTSGSVLNFSNSTIIAETQTGNAQWLVDLRDGGISASFSNCAFTYSGTPNSEGANPDKLFAFGGNQKNSVTMTNCTITKRDKVIAETVDLFDNILFNSYPALYSDYVIDGVQYTVATGGSVLTAKPTVTRNANYAYTSGTFYVDPTDYVAEGVMVYEAADNEYIVGNFVAKINNTPYATLAEAFAAANASTDASVTITLLADCDTGAADINNPLVLSKANATFDLNNKTVTVNNNFSLVMQGNGITVSNGKIYSGPNSAKKTNYNSYVLVVNNCENVNLTGLEMLGGVSIGGSQSDWGEKAGAAKNVTITACQITSGDYYAVCSQMGSDATIVSGTYISNQNAVNNIGNLSPAVIYGRFVGNDGPEGYITVTGGSFSGKIGDANKGWIVLKGGIYTVKPSDSLADADYEVVSNTDSATMGTYPWTVKSHEHSYGVPTWTWGRINGAWAAAATFACTKSDDTQNVRAEVKVSEDTEHSYKTITATVIFEGKTYTATRTEEVSYEVTFNGAPINRYKWGELCTLTFTGSSTTGNAAWYLDSTGGTLLADGRKTYTFAVTSDMDVYAVASNAADPVSVVSAKIVSDESGKAVFNAKWSLPTGATVNSVTMYRGWASSNKDISAATLRQKGTAYNSDLLVRNGDFTFNISNATSGTYQYAVIVINYTPVGGTTTELVSAVVKVQIQ